MPLYEYACRCCAHHFDVRHGADEKPALSCPECAGDVRKVFHAAGIIFKGSGWHINDYDPSRKAKADEERTEATKAEVKTDTKSDAKPETTAETNTESTPAPKTPAPAGTTA